jgi:Ca2+-binding RTX toxin-like protein
MAEINGTDSTDTLVGTAGNDSLRPFLGNDTVDGGGGYDFVEYFASPVQVAIDLNLGIALEFSGGTPATDRLIDIEAATGSGNSDGIIGSFAPNVLLGLAGDDTIQGLTDNDTIDGGDGLDRAVYLGGRAEYTITAIAGGFLVADSVAGRDGTDAVLGVEEFEFNGVLIPAGDLGAGGTPTPTPTPTPAPEPTPTPTPAPTPAPETVSVTRDGVSTQEPAALYSGPVGYLQFQFLGTAGGESARGTARNDFMNLLGGTDAADGGAGDDVLDGGTGSNFLTGGAGRDVFFLDGRGGGVTWSTITDWQQGEELSLWGWRSGVSRAEWVDSAGAEGFRGVTMHADLDGNGSIDASVTWSGRSRGDLPTPTEHDGLLWFHP